MKVLISSGGTEEFLDRVRSFTNFSTGKTGIALTKYFLEKGADVVFLRGRRVTVPDSFVVLGNQRFKEIVFDSCADLSQQMEKILNETAFDAFIHLAAVSDYTVESIWLNEKQFVPGKDKKIRSGGNLQVHFKPTEKIINHVKEWACNTPFVLVGFKLTDTPIQNVQEEQVAELFKRSGADFIVHNDFSEIGEMIHRTRIWIPGCVVSDNTTREELASELFKLIEERAS